jgi:hypothetical protein
MFAPDARVFLRLMDEIAPLEFKKTSREKV